MTYEEKFDLLVEELKEFTKTSKVPEGEFKEDFENHLFDILVKLAERGHNLGEMP